MKRKEFFFIHFVNIIPCLFFLLIASFANWFVYWVFIANRYWANNTSFSSFPLYVIQFATYLANSNYLNTYLSITRWYIFRNSNDLLYRLAKPFPLNYGYIDFLLLQVRKFGRKTIPYIFFFLTRFRLVYFSLKYNTIPYAIECNVIKFIIYNYYTHKLNIKEKCWNKNNGVLYV